MKKTKKNYCINCEEIVKFIRGKCEYCKGKYDDVVPMSYRDKYSRTHSISKIAYR